MARGVREQEVRLEKHSPTMFYIVYHSTTIYIDMPILCSSNANALALGILLKTRPIVLSTEDNGPDHESFLENELRPQSRVDARNIRMAMPAAAWLK